MENSLLNVLIAGIFTIIGGLIGGLLSHHGAGFFKNIFTRTKVIKCHGTAQEMGLSEYGFSKREKKLSFEFKSVEIKMKGENVIFKGRVLTNHIDGIISEGDVQGIGKLINNFMYFRYFVEETDNGLGEWNGVALVRRGDVKDWFGYWLTKDIYHEDGNDFIFGVVKLIPY